MMNCDYCWVVLTLPFRIERSQYFHLVIYCAGHTLEIFSKEQVSMYQHLTHLAAR